MQVVAGLGEMENRWSAVVTPNGSSWKRTRLTWYTVTLFFQQPELLIHGRMDLSFHIVCVTLWPQHLNVAAEMQIHCSRQHFLVLYCPIFGPSASKFISRVPKCSGEYLGCTKWLFQLLASNNFEAASHSLISVIYKAFSPKNYSSLDIFSFLCGECMGQSHQICSFLKYHARAWYRQRHSHLNHLYPQLWCWV